MPSFLGHLRVDRRVEEEEVEGEGSSQGRPTPTGSRRQGSLNPTRLSLFLGLLWATRAPQCSIWCCLGCVPAGSVLRSAQNAHCNHWAVQVQQRVFSCCAERGKGRGKRSKSGPAKGRSDSSEDASGAKDCSAGRSVCASAAASPEEGRASNAQEVLPAAASAAAASACMRAMKSAFSVKQACSSQPTATAMPASRSVRMPWPPTSGLGSEQPTTTRATPAATSARLQGGVRPWWLQGSSVTYAVAPAAACPAARRAYTSACGKPARG